MDNDMTKDIEQAIGWSRRQLLRHGRKGIFPHINNKSIISQSRGNGFHPQFTSSKVGGAALKVETHEVFHGVLARLTLHGAKMVAKTRLQVTIIAAHQKIVPHESIGLACYFKLRVTGAF